MIMEDKGWERLGIIMGMGRRVASISAKACVYHHTHIIKAKPCINAPPLSHLTVTADPKGVPGEARTLELRGVLGPSPTAHLPAREREMIVPQGHRNS